MAKGRTRGFGHGGGDPGYEVLIQRLPELDANAIVVANLNGFCGGVPGLLMGAAVSMTGNHSAGWPEPRRPCPRW